MMKGQDDLLSWIIQWWDEQHHLFCIGGHELLIKNEDVIFLISLPCREPRPNLTGARVVPRTTMEMIQAHSISNTALVSNHILIAWITSIPMR